MPSSRQSPQRSVVAVAHVLPVDVRNHLRALADAKLLRTVFTGFAYQSDRCLERCGRTVDSWLSTQITDLLAKRSEIEGVRTDDISSSLLPEMLRFFTGASRVATRFSPVVNDWVKQHISKRASCRLRKSDQLVLAREFEARELFEAAADQNLVRFYQLPTPHYKTVDRILQRELDEYPDADLMRRHEQSMSPRRIARKEIELETATRILVPSPFVAKSLVDAGLSAEKIDVLPFAAEPEWTTNCEITRNSNLFLHVGQLSIRKGTHRLLRAWKQLKAYRTNELRLIGAMRLPARYLRDFAGMYNHVGRLPRRMLRHHYSSAGCFVFPALAEGFAVVVLEALSCGTPILVSRNSGAEGFIREYTHGVLHDAQDDDQLCEALEWMLIHPTRRMEMSIECQRLARGWTWEHYRRAFLSIIANAFPDTIPVAKTHLSATATATCTLHQ